MMPGLGSHLETNPWTKPRLAALRRKSVAWFRRCGRSLPWRLTDDPYAIWISEIMLQQTQVATVIPYYERFLNSFPTVNALAMASLDDVYHHWSGLGYYRRARQLHEAAQVVLRDFHGRFPMKLSEVSSLPGIGRYTAGAILSFSADQRLPIVEANTQRLYARLLHLQEDLSTSSAQAKLWQFAEQILPPKTGSGELNQSLMEIGAQVCLPKNPRCTSCPLQELCPTFASGSQATIPAPKKPKQYIDLQEAALVIVDRQGRVLIRRCAPQERWAGLWDFPRFDITDCRTHQSICAHLKAQFESRFGQEVVIGKAVHKFKHAVTKYRITLHAYEAQLESGRRKPWPENVEAMWASSEQVAGLALSASGKKLWKMIEGQ